MTCATLGMTCAMLEIPLLRSEDAKGKKMNAEKRGSGNITVVLDELGECVSGGVTTCQFVQRINLLREEETREEQTGR